MKSKNPIKRRTLTTSKDAVTQTRGTHALAPREPANPLFASRSARPVRIGKRSGSLSEALLPGLPRTIRSSDNEIAVGGYYLWVASGCPQAPDAEYWLQAAARLANATAREAGASRAALARRHTVAGPPSGNRTATSTFRTRQRPRSTCLSP